MRNIKHACESDGGPSDEVAFAFSLGQLGISQAALDESVQEAEAA